MATIFQMPKVKDKSSAGQKKPTKKSSGKGSAASPMSSSDPTSVTQIQALKAVDLRSLCSKFGVDQKMGRKTREALLCHALGIATTGEGTGISPAMPKNDNLSKAQMEEYSMLTPHFVMSLSGWTKNLMDAPTMDIKPIKDYLLSMDTITATQSRKYKESRPYQLKEFIHNVYFNALPDLKTFCCLKGECLPSLSTAADDVKAVISVLDRITGDPVGGYCTCTAG